MHMDPHFHAWKSGAGAEFGGRTEPPANTSALSLSWIPTWMDMPDEEVQAGRGLIIAHGIWA
jgi:hypothetical protein